MNLDFPFGAINFLGGTINSGNMMNMGILEQGSSCWNPFYNTELSYFETLKLHDLMKMTNCLMWNNPNWTPIHTKLHSNIRNLNGKWKKKC